MCGVFGVRSVELITNNPLKLEALVQAGIAVRGRIQLPSPSNPHNLEYLRVKRERTGHLIVLDDEDQAAKTG